MANKPTTALSEYHSKRDFRKTSEPSDRKGETGPVLKRDGNPLFVVQQHDANTMHWDFRLEADGVLKSWAIPKGPSTNPKDKRLAVATEDHPLDYADFEGTIPEGEYGAGTVLVWDAGPYKNITRNQRDEEVPVGEAVRQGRLEIWLEGKKLRGGYVLVNAKLRGKEENWLLIKMKDEGADARRNPTNTEPRSVLSDRTIAEVAGEAE